MELDHKVSFKQGRLIWRSEVRWFEMRDERLIAMSTEEKEERGENKKENTATAIS